MHVKAIGRHKCWHSPSADRLSTAVSRPSSRMTSSPGCASSRTEPWNVRASACHPSADTANVRTHTQLYTHQQWLVQSIF